MIPKGFKHTKETKDKLKRSNLGKKHDVTIINLLKQMNLGENNPMFGREHSEKNKQMIREKMTKYYLSIKDTQKYKEFLVKLKNINTGENNPSKRKESRYKMLGENNPSKRWEVRQKLQSHRKLQILPLKDTSIELKIQNYLKQLNRDFFTHQYMNIKHGYQCDIFIPSLNLVIECDGDYWHKYPTGNDIDYIRTKELIEKGFKVLRLWEFEINEMSIKDFENKIHQIKTEVSSVGDKLNIRGKLNE